jgi:hypothetical protein
VDIDDVVVDGPESITAASTCGSLEPGESCLVTVTFSPQDLGGVRAVLIAEHSGINDDLEIPVVGTAIDPPRAFVSVDPVNLDFGVIPLGEDDSRPIVITNAGDLEVRVLDIRIDSRLFVRDRREEEARRCATLAPGESCTIDVRFVAAEPGFFEAILFIDHSGQNPSFEVRLSGIAPEPANLVIEIIEMSDATNDSAADPLSVGTVEVAITNTGQTATRNAFEYRIERSNPTIEDSWIPALTSEGNQTRFTFRGSIAPGETITAKGDLGFPTRDYAQGSLTGIRAEVDSCFAEEFIEVPPCRVAESNEEDNVSNPVEFRVFYEKIE